MEREFYYIYCKGILGVKTNIKDFKWIYGSVAPLASQEEYEKCLIQFDVCLKEEKNLTQYMPADKTFQAYSWNEGKKTVFYRRRLPLNLEIGYNLGICENKVFAEIGKNYFKFIKNRTMNLHGIYYLLSDVANIMLLKNGFLSLYASSVYHNKSKRGVVCFAPPNTGKTFTATRLCNSKDYYMISEDVAVTNGKKVFSCPWTSSYRKVTGKSAETDFSKRVNPSSEANMYDECDITDVMVLSTGKGCVGVDKQDITKRIDVLNGYLFNQYSSPIVKILGYFDDEFYKPWSRDAAEILETIVDNCDCKLLQAEKSEDFSNMIQEIIG